MHLPGALGGFFVAHGGEGCNQGIDYAGLRDSGGGCLNWVAGFVTEDCENMIAYLGDGAAGIAGKAYCSSTCFFGEGQRIHSGFRSSGMGDAESNVPWSQIHSGQPNRNQICIIMDLETQKHQPVVQLINHGCRGAYAVNMDDIGVGEKCSNFGKGLAVNAGEGVLQRFDVGSEDLVQYGGGGVCRLHACHIAGRRLTGELHGKLNFERGKTFKAYTFAEADHSRGGCSGPLGKGRSG